MIGTTSTVVQILNTGSNVALRVEVSRFNASEDNRTLSEGEWDFLDLHKAVVERTEDGWLVGLRLPSGSLLVPSRDFRSPENTKARKIVCVHGVGDCLVLGTDAVRGADEDAGWQWRLRLRKL